MAPKKTQPTPPPVPPGLRLDKDETDMTKALYLNFAEAMKKEGKLNLYNKAMDLYQRVDHAFMECKGVPEEIQERLERGLAKAFETGDPEIATRALQSYMTTVLRLHPNGCRIVATQAVGYANHAITSTAETIANTGMQEGSTMVLERVDAKVNALFEDYQSSGEWPDTQEFFEWFKKWLNAGASQLARGQDPWSEDEAIQAASE